MLASVVALPFHFTFVLPRLTIFAAIGEPA